jgi:hypothetical protein
MMPMETETLDKLYLEWSQFTKARTRRELSMQAALSEISASMQRNWDDPINQLDWCIERAQIALLST